MFGKCSMRVALNREWVSGIVSFTSTQTPCACEEGEGWGRGGCLVEFNEAVVNDNSHCYTNTLTHPLAQCY